MTMASTTSAAASMLLSGSVSSSDKHNQHLTAGSMLSSYHPNMTTTLSATAPFPTITLDLTNPSSDYHLREPPFNFPFLTNTHHNYSLPDKILTLEPSEAQQYMSTKFSGIQSSNQEAMKAATTAITADPQFMATLVAVISSIITNDGVSNNQDKNNNFMRN
ncbi:hypothetical protein L2E82_26036 [Cichorium intybus]|uniref:Uncharacterized protein n=1 Tax=Cichorium intybus TaxID=13427 RepID=A0ACB9E5K0_CICIN|nr:hypothetical protein L2E82_26036 [Cichorium intybus]